MTNTFPELSPRQWVGIALLALSTVAWIAAPVVLLMDVGSAEGWGWAAIIYGFSQVTWYLCLPLLGPELLALGRKWWQRLKTALRPPADQGR